MKERYGLEPSIVVDALARGRRMRFRAGLEEPDAIALGALLESLGARVSLPVSPSVSEPEPAPGPPSLSLTLTTLDGADEASLAPVSSPTVRARPGPPSDRFAPTPAEAQDRFAPPVSREPELELSVRTRARGTLSAPVEPPPSPRPEPARFEAPAAYVSPRRELRARLREPHPRLVIGVALALLLGFLPAHVYASFAEDKLDEIRAELLRQPPPVTVEEHEAVSAQFAHARERLVRVRNRIAVVAALVWLLSGAGVAYGFWRLVTPEEPEGPGGPEGHPPPPRPRVPSGASPRAR